MKQPLNPLKGTLRKAFLSSPFRGLGGLLFFFGCINLYSQGNTIDLISYQIKNNSIALETNNSHLIIQHWGDGCFRLVLTDGTSVPNPTDAVIAKQMNDNPILVSSTNGLIYQWQKYQISVQSSPLKVILNDSLGIEKVSATYCLAIDSLHHRGFVFDLTDGEKITGGGARAIPMNRRGYQLRLNNEPHWGYGYGEENLNYSLPVFVSSQKYLVFYDAPERA
jgi:oligosaccharide 4-alpha-D-glucosyltransferase